MLGPDSRVLPWVLGGATLALLTATLVYLGVANRYHSPSVLAFAAACIAFVASAIIAAVAPSRRSAWRRLLALAAALSFVVAWALWQAPPVGMFTGTIQGARAENAPGFSLLILVAVMLLAILGPVAVVALGVVLAFFAWQLGREPQLRRIRKFDEV